MALILPAISGARTTARITQVSTEIGQLDNGIAKFKSVYGIEPPSSLHVPGLNGTWTASDRSKVRSIWPQFDFATSPPSGSNLGDANYLWNGGLNNPTELHCNGAECLVFFLGGVENVTSTPPIVLGFSKEPRFPWSSVGTNREGPFYEFDNGRFSDIDSDSLLEFLDPLPEQKTPYAYFSSQGRSYTTLNGTTGASISAQDDFDIHGGVNNPLDLSRIYLKTATPSVPQRPDSFQIISPGIDGAYGVGGVYTDGSELTGPRASEADNITNFSGGLLKK